MWLLCVWKLLIFETYQIYELYKYIFFLLIPGKIRNHILGECLSECNTWSTLKQAKHFQNEFAL